MTYYTLCAISVTFSIISIHTYFPVVMCSIALSRLEWLMNTLDKEELQLCQRSRDCFDLQLWYVTDCFQQKGKFT